MRMEQFSRLEEPFGPSGAAAPGAEDRTHSASVDGIYAGLFALTVAGPRSAGRKTAPLFRTTAPSRSPRHAENLECPLDGYLPTLGSALGTTGNRTLGANSLPAGSWPRGRYAFLLLALRKLNRFENIPCVYLLTGP